MISQEEIIKRLQGVLKTQSVKDRISKISDRSASLSEIINRFKTELMNYFPEQIRDGVSISSSSHKSSDGGHEVEISFEKVWRPSLDPEEFPRGADNIVLLFNNGYHTTNGATIYGYWETAREDVFSLASREALYFLQAFVRDFNSKYGEEYGLEVTLSPIYDK